MKKPEVVCVVGSAMLAPVMLAAMSGSGILVLWYLDVWYQMPDWLVWIFFILALVLTPFVLFSFYRWLFWHCRKRMTR